MSQPGDFAYQVKQQADIVRIVGDYVKLKKSGAQNFSGLCPFHNEKSPSFSVHASRQFYHCFGCGVSGDVFSFVQKIENSSFPVDWLNSGVGHFKTSQRGSGENQPVFQLRIPILTIDPTLHRTDDGT